MTNLAIEADEKDGFSVQEELDALEDEQYVCIC